MDRRSYLGALSATGFVGIAGCFGAFSDDDSETVLGPPSDDDPRSQGDPIHPTHGEEFPAFSILDPLAGVDVSLDDFVGERAFLITFIFTSCPDEACATMVRTLRVVQDDAAEREYDDDVSFLAMTFDPETDDAETLQAYGTNHDVDLDAGNWHFLRPETQDEALSLVNDTFGSPVEVVPPDDHDHDHNGSDHDHDDSPEVNEETTTHYDMIFLVNERGIVERSYPRAAAQYVPDDIIDDLRAVVE